MCPAGLPSSAEPAGPSQWKELVVMSSPVESWSSFIHSHASVVPADVFDTSIPPGEFWRRRWGCMVCGAYPGQACSDKRTGELLTWSHTYRGW